MLAVAWVITQLLIWPRGNFPLNDDFNYAATVNYLLTRHELIISRWSLTASLTQAVIGGLFCLVAGFSFEILRLSTILFGFAAIVLIYFLALNCGASAVVALISTLMFFCNPIFVNLSDSFMTDVPFLALAAITLLAMNKTISASGTSSRNWLAVAGFASLAACLQRQTGLVIPLAFAISYCAGSRKDSSRRQELVLTGLLPLTLSLAGIGLFQNWLSTNGMTPAVYQLEKAYLSMLFSRSAPAIALNSLATLLRIFMYLGTFLLPLLMVLFPRYLAQLTTKERRLTVAVTVQVAALLSIGCLVTNSLMPLGDNVLFDFGVGPVMFPLHRHDNFWPTAPRIVWQAVTIAGAVGAAMLSAFWGVPVVRLFTRRSLHLAPAASRQLLFYGSAIVFYVFVIALRGFFDRYLLFVMLLLVPFLIISSGPSELSEAGDSAGFDRQRAKFRLAILGAAAAVLVCSESFSIAALHDYFSSNRVRWRAISYLTDELHINPALIDGGYEFNGWNSCDLAYQRSVPAGTFLDVMHHDDYAVSLGPIAGFDVIRRYNFNRWLPPGSGEIVVLKKHAGLAG